VAFLKLHSTYEILSSAALTHATALINFHEDTGASPAIFVGTDS